MFHEHTAVVDELLDDEWDLLIGQFSDANYRQLSAYSIAAASRVGGVSQNVAIRIGSDLIGLCNIRIKKIPFLSFGIAYVNGAPLVRKYACTSDYDVKLALCLRALKNKYVNRQGNVLRIVGLARADSDPKKEKEIFEKEGFSLSDAKGRYRTMFIDTRQAVSDIRAAMNQMWRRNLSKAERQDIQITRGTEQALFLEYETLHRSLIHRKGLNIDLGPEYFMGVQKGLSSADQFVVHLAKHEGRLVAGHIGAFHGDTAVFLLGATNEAGLECKASYLLHWRVIEYAKELKLNWYDLGGIDPEGNPGVYSFKFRTGAVDICAPGPYEAGTWFRRRLLRALEYLYRMIRS